MSPQWSIRVELGDVFHDDDMPWAEKRSRICARIEAATSRCMPDWDLEEIIEEIHASQNPDEFDLVWDRFYDWADRNRVWVDPFTPFHPSEAPKP